MPKTRLPNPSLASLTAAGLAGLLMTVAQDLAAQGTDEARARLEIGSLLKRVEHSKCRFLRAGAWHSSEAARVHLERKLEFALMQQPMNSAEDFVARIASGSSSTGEAYKIQCAGALPEFSAQWLQRELVAIRQGAASAPAAAGQRR